MYTENRYLDAQNVSIDAVNKCVSYVKHISMYKHIRDVPSTKPAEINARIGADVTMLHKHPRIDVSSPTSFKNQNRRETKTQV